MMPICFINTKILKSLNPNNELVNIHTWLNFVIFHPPRRKLPFHIILSLNSINLNQEYSEKISKYYEYSNLSWKSQVRHSAGEIKRNIGTLSKLRYYVNSDILVKLYYALIYPFLTYGLISWSKTSSSATQPLFVSQKRAIRVLTFSKFREQSSPIFNALILLNCLTFSFLISQSLCITFTIDVCHLCLILSSHKLVKDTFIIQEVSGMIFLITSEYKESF